MKSPKIKDEIYYNIFPYHSKIRREFKVFIDHIDNDDRRIWAVKVKDGPYLTARQFVIQGRANGKGIRKDQPRAVITGKGYVTQLTDRLIVIEC